MLKIWAMRAGRAAQRSQDTLEARGEWLRRCRQGLHGLADCDRRRYAGCRVPFTQRAFGGDPVGEVSGEHSKASAPTTPLARPKTSVTMPVSGCRRLKLASGSLITLPTCRTVLYGGTDIDYHRDHLEYVLGERAGHCALERCLTDLRDSGDITLPSVSGSAPTAFRRTASTDARLVGGGVAPG